MGTQTQRAARRRDEGSVATEILEAGAVAGLIAGVAMVLVAMTYASAIGIGLWRPLKAVAATFVGTSAYAMGPRAVLIGVAIHIFTSVAVGILFAFVVPRDVSLVPALALGALAGVAVLVVLNIVVLPTSDWTGGERRHLLWGNIPGAMPLPMAFVVHLIYGAGIGLAPSLRRRFG
jgi:hypothetical protein